jgi:hypothetical protein
MTSPVAQPFSYTRVEFSAWFVAGGGVGEAGRRAHWFCGEVARGGCSLAWNFGVTRSAVLTEAL